jgi:hypothetical protein
MLFYFTIYNFRLQLGIKAFNDISMVDEKILSASRVGCIFRDEKKMLIVICHGQYEEGINDRHLSTPYLIRLQVQLFRHRLF